MFHRWDSEWFDMLVLKSLHSLSCETDLEPNPWHHGIVEPARNGLIVGKHVVIRRRNAHHQLAILRRCVVYLNGIRWHMIPPAGLTLS